MVREVHDDESAERGPIGCIRAAVIILVSAVSVGLFMACGYLWVASVVTK